MKQRHELLLWVEYSIVSECSVRRCVLDDAFHMLGYSHM